MAEPELFGIGISTIANLGVAFGTGLLAYYTYKSVKASEEQVKLARNTIEKPRILQKIHNVLNGIGNEMDPSQRIVNYFSVKSIDAAIKQVKSLGGSILWIIWQCQKWATLQTV